VPRYSDSDDFEWEEDGDEEPADANEAEELQAIIDRAEEFAEVDEFRRAVRLWRQNIDRFADEPLAYYHYGQACFRLLSDDLIHEEMWENNADAVGIYEEALSALEEAVSMDKDHAPSWNMIGALYALRGNNQLAIEAWEKSLAIDPTQDQVRRDLRDLKGHDDDEEE